MEELLVVLAALVTLVLSIAGMNIYRRRTDVLTGPYISNRDHEQTIPDSRVDRVDRATAERGARCAPSGNAARAERAKRQVALASERMRPDGGFVLVAHALLRTAPGCRSTH